MKVTRIIIKDYRGIEALTVKVPPAGVVVEGGNHRGKTTILNAVVAALAGRGISAKDIRRGKERAEVMVDIDDLHVRRLITKKSSTVDLTNADGFSAKRPMERLTELLGTSSELDPLEFFLAKSERRQQLAAAAMPVRVTTEDVTRWTGRVIDINLDRHGWEVMKELRDGFYSQRAAANKVAKERQTEAEVAAELYMAARVQPGADTRLSVADADQLAAEAKTLLQRLEARKEAADTIVKTSESTRARIAELRHQGEKLRKELEPAPDITPAKDRLGDARAAVAVLEADLKAAQAEVARLEDTLAARHELDARNTQVLHDAQRLDDQAAELEASIALVEDLHVSAADIEAATQAVGEAVADVQNAWRAQTAKEEGAKHKAAEDVLAQAEARAKELDLIVKVLTDTAPAELAARAEAIPGFDFDTMALDGVPLETLSGEEQMRFGIDLARRANAKAKILVVDGLERIDNDERETFIRYACRDDWQLIASRVTAGELIIEAIEP